MDPKWKEGGHEPAMAFVVIQGIVAYWEKIGLGDTAAEAQGKQCPILRRFRRRDPGVIRGDVAVAELTDIPLNPALEDGAPRLRLSEVRHHGFQIVYFRRREGAAPERQQGVHQLAADGKGQDDLQKFGGLSATRPGVPPLSHLPATSTLSNTVDALELPPPAKQKRLSTTGAPVQRAVSAPSNPMR